MVETTDVESKLKNLAAKQKEWRELAPERKLELLEQLNKAMSTFDSMPAWTSMCQANTQMMGIPLDTPEGKYMVAMEKVACISVSKDKVKRLQVAYMMRCGTHKKASVYDHLQSRVAHNGQVVTKVHPLLLAEKMGPFGMFDAEIWFQPDKIQKPSQVKPFQIDHFDDKADDIMVVLGAGNQSFLTITDVLEGLFVRNRVVFLKHHPLRGKALDPVLRMLFECLYERGYLDSEIDQGLERSAAMLSSPFVGAVHMTGGKKTHDAIVWGSTLAEQQKRKAAHDPKLKAKMTSELGCVTPWIVTPAVYSRKELENTVGTILDGVHSMASANCLSPKIIILPKSWAQRQEFLDCFYEMWQAFELPVAYYPGAQDRWEAFQKAYPSAKVLDSNTGRGIKERQLSAPMLGSKGPVLLPLLAVELEVDLSTEQGQNNAKSEYAFLNEPFAPVVTFATIDDENDETACNGGPSYFLDNAVDLCNNYVFGSLSCSMTAPPTVDNDLVEKAIAGLRYGAICVNMWTTAGYLFGWGGFPGEKLDAVESGEGVIQNYLFLPHFEKCVVRCPFGIESPFKKSDDHELKTREAEATASFILVPGLKTFANLMIAMLGITPAKVLGFARLAAAAAVLGVATQVLLARRK